MTQEEIQLLLKDLCGRIPYVTFVYVDWHETEELEICDGCEDEKEEPNIHTLISCDYYGECDLDDNLYKTVYDIKPYLRPMSSMTEEERKELAVITTFTVWTPKVYEWYLEPHFDIHKLIEKGLALEAPKGMYKTD